VRVSYWVWAKNAGFKKKPGKEAYALHVLDAWDARTML